MSYHSFPDISTQSAGVVHSSCACIVTQAGTSRFAADPWVVDSAFWLSAWKEMIRALGPGAAARLPRGLALFCLVWRTSGRRGELVCGGGKGRRPGAWSSVQEPLTGPGSEPGLRFPGRLLLITWLYISTLLLQTSAWLSFRKSFCTSNIPNVILLWFSC